MGIRDHVRATSLALLAGATFFAAPTSNAMPIPFHPDAVASFDGSGGSTGFDNSELGLIATRDITNAWSTAGVPMIGETFDIELSEMQTLRDDTQQGRPGEELNVMGPWTSLVEWEVTNTTGQEGPVLLFFSGLQEFADPNNPAAPAAEQYLPAEVGILPNENLSVIRYVASSDTFYYLAFLIEDFSSPVTLSFEYQVERDIIGFETPELGTPILQMNAFFLPEPSGASMMIVGLIGLAYVGRRRSH